MTSVDKANVLATSRLWRKTVTRMAAAADDLAVDHLYVDNASMQIILRPEQFDVLLTSNLFGDILSDEAAALAGSIGMVPSWSAGDGPPLVEPIHGTAPQLVGKDMANPSGDDSLRELAAAGAVRFAGSRGRDRARRWTRCWPAACARGISPRRERGPWAVRNSRRKCERACARGSGSAGRSGRRRHSPARPAGFVSPLRGFP